MAQKQYKVIRDTREQSGWYFAPTDYCLGTEIRGLPTGDYTLEGYEDKFIIERKGRIGEWANNINDKRFYRELLRLDKFKHAYIFLEFTMEDVIKFPVGSTIPRSKWQSLRTSSGLIMKRTHEIMINHNVQILFVGNFGISCATSLFKRISESVE